MSQSKDSEEETTTNNRKNNEDSPKSEESKKDYLNQPTSGETGHFQKRKTNIKTYNESNP
jgi:hypothetical protein